MGKKDKPTTTADGDAAMQNPTQWPDDIRLATIRKIEAEIAKIEADRQMVEQETRVESLIAERNEVELRAMRRKEKEELAGNKYHHVYAFNVSVSSASVSNCIDQLTQWHRDDPTCEIEIVFNSPGGDVVNGMALFDYMRDMRARGHKITTVTLGYAASMAGILLQAGDVRVVGREAWVLIHEASFGAGGKIGEVEDTVDWVKRIQKRILKIFAERSTLSEHQIAKRWKRKDWWLSSDECLKFGFADDIR